MKNNPKKYIKGLAVVALAFALVSTAVAINTAARYQSTYSGSGSVDIAKWEINVQGKSSLTTISDKEISVSPTVTKQPNVSANVAAPGTSGAIAELTITNSGETLAYYELVLEIKPSANSATANSATAKVARSFNFTGALGGTAAGQSFFERSGVGYESNVKTITFKGNIPQGENVKCNVNWEWVWNNNADDNASDTTIDGLDYSVSIKRLDIIQQQSGSNIDGLN